MRDVRLLLDFAAVAQDLSFSSAASRLGVPQPWLSTRIRKLEAMLGAPLFDRNTRSVKLTAFGQELFDHVRPLAETAEVVLAETERFRLGESGRLRIGCPQLGEPDRKQAAMFARFSAAHPGIVLVIEPGSTDIHLHLLRQGILDFVLTVMVSGMEERPGLEWIHLYPLAHAAMMHADDPLAGTDPLIPAAFYGRRLAMFPRERAPGFHDLVYGDLLASGVEPVFVPELRRSLLRGAPDLIVSTIVPAPADAPLRHGTVRRTIAGGPDICIALVRRISTARSRAAQRFWSFAQGFSDAC